MLSLIHIFRDANMKDLRTICLELSDLTQRAKDNKLTSDQLGGATITITNLGKMCIRDRSRTRHGMEIKIKTGVKKDGTIISQDMQVIINAGAYAGGTRCV